MIIKGCNVKELNFTILFCSISKFDGKLVTDLIILWYECWLLVLTHLILQIMLLALQVT